MKFIDNKVTLLNQSGFESALPKISANKNVTDISNNKVLSLAVDYLRIPSKNSMKIQCLRISCGTLSQV